MQTTQALDEFPDAQTLSREVTKLIQPFFTTASDNYLLGMFHPSIERKKLLGKQNETYAKADPRDLKIT